MPRRSCLSSASNRIASSSSERPTVSPVPAEFSISSQVVSEHRFRDSRSAGTTRSTPASNPEPRWEPTWKTTASASIAQATSIVFWSAATDLS